MSIHNTNEAKREMGFPEDGQKVVFSEPLTIHWFTNVVKDQELLEIGKEYTVRKTQLNSSSSFVWLEEVEAYDAERDLPFFNLWSFDWEGRPKSWLEEQRDRHLEKQ
jgi:hypothetical protein